MKLQPYPNAFAGTPFGEHLESKLVESAKNREEMARLYAICIVFSTGGSNPGQYCSWKTLNEKILKRWSRSGLEYIKRKAWEILDEPVAVVVCCQDPEYCVEAKCVECPNCQGFDTLRTTQPDPDNVSEFMCFDCGEIFTAMNP